MSKGFFNWLFGTNEQPKTEKKHVVRKPEPVVCEMVKVGDSYLTKEQVSSFNQKDIIEYLNDNKELLFNAILPIFSAVYKRNLLKLTEFNELLEDSFLVNQNNQSLSFKIIKINSIKQKLKKELDSAFAFRESFGIEVNTSSLKKRGIHETRNYYSIFQDLLQINLPQVVFQQNNMSDIEDTFESLRYFGHELSLKSVVTNYIKNICKITILELFIFKDLLTDLQSDSNSEIHKIIFNAINKFANPNIVAEKTYKLFLESYDLDLERFSIEIYKDFIAYIVADFNTEDELYLAEELGNLEIENLTEHNLSGFNAYKLAKTLIYEQMVDKIIFADYFNEYLKIDQVEQIIKEKQVKDDLLNNDYTSDDVITIDDIDLMSGTDFEEYIKTLFEKMKYKCKLTKASGDQGVDIIAEKDNMKIAIQAKCYSGKVGNHAIMEAVAGMKYYNANRCMVITNSYFTKTAIELAKANKVVLWNRDALIEKMYDK